MRVELDDVISTFCNFNEEAPYNLSEYLNHNPDLIPMDKEMVSEAEGLARYILKDIDKLFDKSLLNLCSCDYLLNKGYFSWAVITAYYAGFFAVQALNRLQLKFYTFLNSQSVLIESIDFNDKFKLKIKNSKDSHQREFDLFMTSYSGDVMGLEPFWRIGISKIDDRLSEPKLRNMTNYNLGKEYFNELDLSGEEFNRCIKTSGKRLEFSNSLGEEKLLARKFLQVAACRMKMIKTYLLMISKKNIVYSLYFKRNNKKRYEEITRKYQLASGWIKSFMREVLK